MGSINWIFITHLVLSTGYINWLYKLAIYIYICNGTYNCNSVPLQRACLEELTRCSAVLSFDRPFQGLSSFQPHLQGGAPKIAKLLQITLIIIYYIIWFTGDIAIVNGDYKQIYKWGAPPCRYWYSPRKMGMLVVISRSYRFSILRIDK